MKQFIAITLLTGSLAFAAVVTTISDQTVREYDPIALQKILVENTSGKIKIVPMERNKVVIVATNRRFTEKCALNTERFEPGLISIQVERPIGEKCEVDLDGASASACTSPASYSALSNGTHSFSVYAKNAAGLADETPATYSWVVDVVPPDTTAPDTSIDNRASLPDVTPASSIEFQFSSIDTTATFECSLDNATYEACASPKSYSGLDNGVHEFAVRGVDSAGNFDQSPAMFNWIVDEIPPVASIISVSPAAAITSSTSIEIQFAANESATFECSIDNNSYGVCISPMQLNSLSEGAHWFAVRATDMAGNVSVPASYSWSTDFTGPVIQIVNSIPAQGLSNRHSLSVEFAVSEPAFVTCSLDGAPAVECTSPFTGTVEAEGAHSLVITATDAAGNDSGDRLVSWVMDYSKPLISFGAMLPSSASAINSQDLSIEVIANEQVDFGATLNGQHLAVSTSPILLNGLPEGAYQLDVTAYDLAGNPGNIITHSFVVDITPPVLNLQLAVSGVTNQDSNQLTISASEASTFECNVNDAGYGPCTSPLAVSGLADGEHVVKVRATDDANNVSIVATASWTVDTIAPFTNLSALQTNLGDFTFSFNSSEAGSSFICSLDGAMASACSSPISYSGLGTGSHYFLVKAIDSAGNVDPNGAPYAISVRPPVSTILVSMSPASSPNNSSSIAFQFASNHNDATFICSFNGASASACSSPMTYSGLAAGSYTFSVKAVDIWGNIDAAGGASHSWSVDLTAPSMASASTSVTSTSITVNWTTNEASTSRLYWGLNNPATPNSTAEDGVYKTTHQVKLLGLSPNTLYYLRPGGRDNAGNTWQHGTPFTARTAR